MDNLKLAGIKKEYECTSRTFTKKGMWPERYSAEISGLTLARSVGVATPRLISSSLTDLGGQTVMHRVYYPRLDQVLWGSPCPDALFEVGRTLALIHTATPGSKEISMRLANRRFQDLIADVANRGAMTNRVTDMVTQVFKKIINDMAGHTPCVVHGDYTIQNIFYASPLVVFDWEHSCVYSALYDIGVALSFLILLVTDGGWSFADYFSAIGRFMEGYKSVHGIKDDDQWIIDGLRFLGHRQVPQYYLFVLEYMAIIEQNLVCGAVLNGKMTEEEVGPLLADMGLNFDQIWLAKLLRCLRAKDYKTSLDFWNAYKERTKT